MSATYSGLFQLGFAESVEQKESKRYAGTYTNTTYGEATVAEESGRLVVRLTASPTYIGDPGHWQYNTFVSTWRDPVAQKTFITFTLNVSGEVDEMKLKIADYIDFGEYAFSRVVKK